MPATTSTQLSLAILERVQLIFANFVDQDGAHRALLDGLSNLLACSASAQSIYIAGPKGSGKTHLLYAVLNASELGYDSSNTQYIDCARLKGYSSVLLDFVPKQVTLLDNVDSLQGERDDEVALFSLIERVRQSGGVFVASSTLGVTDTHWGLADVESRLKAGLMFALTELDEPNTQTALRLRFEAAGLSVSDRVLDYMLTHFSRDKHALFETVSELDGLALREQRPITIPFLKAHLS